MQTSTLSSPHSEQRLIPEGLPVHSSSLLVPSDIKGDFFAQGRATRLHPQGELRSSPDYLSLVAIADKFILHYSKNTIWKVYLEILCKHMWICICLKKYVLVALLMKDYPVFLCFADKMIAKFLCDSYFDPSVCIFKRMPIKLIVCRKPWT